MRRASATVELTVENDGATVIGGGVPELGHATVVVVALNAGNPCSGTGVDVAVLGKGVVLIGPPHATNVVAATSAAATAKRRRSAFTEIPSKKRPRSLPLGHVLALGNEIRSLNPGFPI